MTTLQVFLNENAVADLLAWDHQVEASRRFGLTLAETEEAILESGLLPARYQRNRQTISQSGQHDLFKSAVAVIGCGGLGGYVIEELARLGIGKIIAIDPDVFEEHNLNRQLLSSPQNIGRPKVEAAAARVEEINPAVTLKPFQIAYTPENGAELLRGAKVVVDALDSIPTRLALANTCTEIDLPLVHGAIGVVRAGRDAVPWRRYHSEALRALDAGKGGGAAVGRSSFTPALVASIQVAEVCKIVLGRGEKLRHRKLAVNLLDMEFEEIGF